MTDYKNLKLIASSSPHIRSKDNTRSIMLDVIIALLPALVMSIYVFGVRALTWCWCPWPPACSGSGPIASS